MAIKTSKSNEAYFARYKQGNKYAVNRKMKLERVLKEQPNNKQIELALKAISNTPRRGTPKNPYWSHTMISIAKMFKRYSGKFDKHFFSAKLEDVEAGRRARNDNLYTAPVKTKQNKRISEFSLGARAHDGMGNLVWAQ